MSRAKRPIVVCSWEIGGLGMQEITGRVSSGVAGRDVAGAAGKRGLLLVDWWFEMQGLPGRLPCGVTVRLKSCCARVTWGVFGCQETIC